MPLAMDTYIDMQPPRIQNPARPSDEKCVRALLKSDELLSTVFGESSRRWDTDFRVLSHSYVYSEQRKEVDQVWNCGEGREGRVVTRSSGWLEM